MIDTIEEFQTREIPSSEVDRLGWRRAVRFDLLSFRSFEWDFLGEIPKCFDKHRS